MADKPVTREEKYLAYLTGDYTGELPKPITRKEKYLYELCLKGMGGEVSPEEIKNAVNEYLEKNPVKPGATTEQAQQIEQNKTDIGSLKEDLSGKIDKPSTAPSVGRILKVTTVNDDGTFVCEWADAPSGGGAVDDVQINGKSIVGENRVAKIPKLQASNINNLLYGLPTLSDGNNPVGIGITTHGSLMTIPARRLDIMNRVERDYFDIGLIGSDYHNAICPGYLDYAVKAAMCDGKGDAWTAEEQTSARERMGVISEDDFELIATVNPSKEEIVSSISIDLAEPIKANFYIVCDIGIIDESLNYVNAPKLGLVINNYYTWMYQSLQKSSTEGRYMLMQIPICKKSGLVILSNSIPINNDFQSSKNLTGNGLGLAPYSDRNYSKGITKIEIAVKDNFSTGYFSKNTVFAIYGKRI